MFICMSRTPLNRNSGQVPTAAHMGPALKCITNVPVQANTAANYHINPITPPLVPQHLHPPSHYPFRWGATLFPNIIPIGKYMHPSQTPPSPYLQSRPTAAASW